MPRPNQPERTPKPGERLPLTELAVLLAAGNLPFSDAAVGGVDRDALLRELRRLNRSRILKLVARMIARDIRAKTLEISTC